MLRRNLLLLFLAIMPFTKVMALDDVDSKLILRLTKDYLNAWNTQNEEKIVAHFDKDKFSLFGLNNKLLNEDVGKKNIQSIFKAGLRINFQQRHIKLTSITDDIVLVTGYLVGHLKRGDQGAVQSTWRFSSIRKKAMDSKDPIQWKIVHIHLSNLEP